MIFKFKRFIAVFFLFGFLMITMVRGAGPSLEMRAEPLSSIAFSSCNREDREQVLWDDILAAGPDLWIWGGDNMYADTYDSNVIEEKYNQVKNEPGYQALLDSLPVIGIWDDHDYGNNDVFGEYPIKKTSQRLMLEFLDEVEDSPRWDREGAYVRYGFGPEGKRVNIFLIDNRYFADKARGDTDLLGEAQWAWLTEELHASDANINIFVAGLQIINEDAQAWKWSQWPQERDKFFQLIVDAQVKAPLIITGDRHFGEIAVKDNWDLDYPMYEVTASGMTHVYVLENEPNPYRFQDKYNKMNFGMFHFDWENWSLTMELRGDDGDVGITHEVNLEDIGSLEPIVSVASADEGEHIKVSWSGGGLLVQGLQGKRYDGEIMDTRGRKLQDIRIEEGHSSTAAMDLAAGVYLLQLDGYGESYAFAVR